MTHSEERPEPLRPHRVIAVRVRELRKRRNLTAARLAEEMTKAGVKWDRTIVTNLENGRRSAVSVEEALALAYVLDVAPVHLLVPLESDGWYAVTPGGYSTRNDRVRAWIRGTYALEGHTDLRSYFSEVPADEFDREAELRYVARRVGERTLMRGPDGVVQRMNPVTGQWETVDEPWPESSLSADVDRALGIEPPGEDEQP